MENEILELRKQIAGLLNEEEQYDDNALWYFGAFADRWVDGSVSICLVLGLGYAISGEYKTALAVSASSLFYILFDPVFTLYDWFKRGGYYS